LELKRQRIGTMLRWSGAYLQNTNKNDLSFVDAFNYTQLNETFGSIKKIFEYGDILTVRQAKKNSSFYLSAAVLKQAQQSGADIISTSTEVLGSKRQSTEPYGCVNPESHVSIGTINYYADIDNGIVRDGYSESIVISDLGLNNFIINLFDKIKNYHPKIVGGYDRAKGELWYTIYAYISGDVQKWTIMYNDSEKSWKAYFDWLDANGNVVEIYGDNGVNMFAFNQGIPYLHEAGEGYSKFFGVTVQPKVKIIGHGQGKSIFNSVKLISNKNWKCDSVLVFDNDTYTVGMQSKLPAFTKREGYLYSPFLRDMTTSSPTPTDADLFNGRRLVGQTVEIELQTIESGLTQLYEVEIVSTPSL